MDPDRIKGKIKQAEGKAQDAVGDLTDDPTDDIKGKAKQAEGKIQEAWGKSKDAARKALDD
jgi:uncharacterized protein YjbJ (UPF0337 family)